jgi:uncharacterized membrane protein YgcG
MRTTLTVIAVALVGLFGAASLGYAAYVVSRDQVGLPVTKLKTPPGSLAPTPATKARRQQKTKTVVPPPPPPPSTTTREPGDDHGGRSRGGSGSSGSGSGGHGGDD